MSFPTVSSLDFLYSPFFSLTPHLFLYLFLKSKFARWEVTWFRKKKKTPKLCSLSSLYLWHPPSFITSIPSLASIMKDAENRHLELWRLVLIFYVFSSACGHWFLQSLAQTPQLSCQLLRLALEVKGVMFSMDLNEYLSWLRGFPAGCEVRGKTCSKIRPFLSLGVRCCFQRALPMVCDLYQVLKVVTLAGIKRASTSTPG